MAKKASDEQIISSWINLEATKELEWYLKFGDSNYFDGVRRSEIQAQLQKDHGISYSDGGMRGRLKALIKKGLVTKEKLYPEADYSYYYLASYSDLSNNLS